jgi:PAS domain S-box-containing protein
MYSENPDITDNKLIAIGIFIALACFVIDMLTPNGVLISQGYVVAIIITLYSRNKKALMLITAVSLILLMASTLIVFLRSGVMEHILNYLISLGTILFSFSISNYIFKIRLVHANESRQMTSMFDNANEGIILTNGKGEIVLANPQVTKLFGYDADELIGQNIDVLIPDKFRNKHAEHRSTYHKAPSNRNMGVGRDLFGKKKDGSVFPVEVSLSFYKSGQESYVIAFIIDITVRKQSDNALMEQKTELLKISNEIKVLNTNLERKVEDRTTMLRETLAQLEKSKEEIAFALEKEKELGDLKSRFVSTVSHEFRTPLAAILSSASLIAKYPTTDENEKRLRHILRIQDSVKHMSAMLEDLLSLGKLEEGLISVRPEEFDVHQYISDFISHQQEIAKNGQKIIYKHTGSNTVITDKKLLTNIIINLLSNAIKFSPENAEIDIVTDLNHNVLNLTVADKGIGISEEDQQHLFERFFRARNATNIAGTGLGLHIVGKYLELLNGQINISSELDKGTKFTVTIPISNNT